MNNVLRDAMRHNTWATGRLVEFCQEAGLTEQQLSTPGVGTFGGILDTLAHVVSSDGHYLRALAGGPSPAEPSDGSDLDDLASRAAELEQGWEQLLSGPIDTERVIVVDDGAHEVHAGVFIAQALNHGNHHREQVCAMLTAAGVQPPDIQAWEYAWATGRLWHRSPD